MSDYFKAGGTLPLSARSYIPRKADEQLYRALLDGEFCYVLSSRQVGKSSLVNRALTRLRQENIHAVNIDLTAIGTGNTREQWYFGLIDILGRQLDLQTEIEAFLDANERLDALLLWMRTLETVALAKIRGSIVVFIDEIEVTRSLTFSADEFFAAIRACYNKRAENPDYNRLSFCLVGSATPAQLVADSNITPFNIGRGIELTDFTPEEAEPFARQLVNAGSEGAKIIERVLYWTNGHPYLTQRLCAELNLPRETSTAAEDVDAICKRVFFSEQDVSKDTNIAFVSNRLVKSGEDTGGVLELYRQLLTQKTGIRDAPASVLHSLLLLSGVARRERGNLRSRNRIYAQVFDRKWIQNNLPEAEKLRVRAAARRATLLTATVASVLLLLISIPSAFAWLQYNMLKEQQIKSKEQQGELEKQERNTSKLNTDLKATVTDLTNTKTVLKAKVTELTKTQNDNAFLNKNLEKRNITLNETQKKKDGLAAELKSRNKDLRDKILLLKAAGEEKTKSANRLAANVQNLKEQQTETKRLLYDADMNLVQQAYDSKNFDLGDRILWQNVTNPERGFEWGHWYLQRGCLRILEGHSEGVNSVAFSPDGKRVVTGSSDKTARIWNAQTGKPLRTLQGHSSYVTSVAFSPDGKRIVTGSDDHTARVWDAETGKPLQELHGHSDYVFSVAFSPDGKRIVTGSEGRHGANMGRRNRQATAKYSSLFS